MTLINASLLAGLALAAVPIVLHLMMRAKPRRIEFPALKLLQTRQTANSRRMRVRHLLLLLLRALLIVVAVIVLARPSLPAAQYGLRWYEWLILIAVAVAALMLYRWRSQRAAREERAAHLLRDRRDRLKSFAAVGGVLAALVLVGLPWGYRVYGEVTAPRSPLSPDVPVSAVFVFDTSLSMTYKHEGSTRLEVASEMGKTHLSTLPAGSLVAVTTSEPDAEPLFQADLAGVRSRIDDLRTTATPRSLNRVIRTAIEAQVYDREQRQQETGTTDQFVREIYILSDMSLAAWEQPDEADLKNLLTQHDWLSVYLIDVSVDNPNNTSLSDLTLDREATVGGQDVQVSATVSATAAAPTTATLEIFMISGSGETIAGGSVRGAPRQQVEFQGSQPVKTFSVIGDASQPYQRGFLRLTNPDPMPFDDIRYFTFGVRPVPRILLVGDGDLDTWFVKNALQPELAERRGTVWYNCKTITGGGFARETLSTYDVICLHNWTRPDPDVWVELKNFVNNGGSLFISTGGVEQLSAGHWGTPDAEEVLPGVPLVPLPFRKEPGRQLNLVADSHPVCRAFADDPEAQAALSQALFDKCWTFDVSPDTRVLMSFNDRDRRPALLERSLGRGRVLLFSSAMDNNGPASRLWNESFINNWVFLMFLDQTMQYLTGATDVRRNFSVGEPVEIPVPADRRFGQYRVARPRFRLTEGSFPFEEKSILLTDIDEAGHYQLRSADEDVVYTVDFAANDLDRESDLQVIHNDELTALLGEERFSRVRNPDQLDRAVNLGRIGIEVFPVLMGLLIILFCLEHLMANYFYDDERDSAPDTAGRSLAAGQ